MRRSKMNVNEAMEILNLTGSPSQDDIKRAYIQAIRQAHPDHGGSEEKAKLINEANEVLSTVRFVVKRDREAFERELKELADGISKVLNKALNPAQFEAYLKEIFEKDFVSTKVEVAQGRGLGTSYLYLTSAFKSPDNETSLTLKGCICLLDMIGTSGMAIAKHELDIPMSIDIFFVHENKKVKPYRQTYNLGTKANDILSPEKILPRAKVEKALVSSKKRKFSKQDMLGTLNAKFGARFDGNYVRIKVGENHEILFYRLVFDRLASWGCNGFYTLKPPKKILQGAMAMIESEDTLNEMERTIKRLQAASPSEIVQIATEELKRLGEASKSAKT